MYQPTDPVERVEHFLITGSASHQVRKTLLHDCSGLFKILVTLGGVAGDDIAAECGFSTSEFELDIVSQIKLSVFQIHPDDRLDKVSTRQIGEPTIGGKKQYENSESPCHNSFQAFFRNFGNELFHSDAWCSNKTSAKSARSQIEPESGGLQQSRKTPEGEK